MEFDLSEVAYCNVEMSCLCSRGARQHLDWGTVAETLVGVA
jgi:hypothetical protein